MMLAPSHTATAETSGAAAVTVQSVERWSCPTLHTAPWETPMMLAFTTAAPESDGEHIVKDKSAVKPHLFTQKQ